MAEVLPEEELAFEEAVSRVYCQADAGSPPEVTRDEVRCILALLKFPAATSDYFPLRSLSSPSAWDEDMAVFGVVDLKCRRAVPLISSSSAGQSTQLNQVREHLERERSRLQPYECG